MKLNKDIFEKIDIKTKLSLLWIFAMFNYLYTDILTFMDPSVLKQFITGTVDGIQMTQGVLLGGAVLMETAMAMIVLSRVLKFTPNRWANILVGAIHTLAVFSSMFVGTSTPHYLFSGIIEVATTSYIVWISWKWKE